jgi:hypothetical protein
VRLERFLQRLEDAVTGECPLHPARRCFDLAAEVGATVEFAGPGGEALGPADWERWQRAGGPDPFVDGEGRATLRVRTSHRISDWVVLEARFTPGGLVVERRYTMLRSWVVDG